MCMRGPFGRKRIVNRSRSRKALMPAATTLSPTPYRIEAATQTRGMRRGDIHTVACGKDYAGRADARSPFPASRQEGFA